MAEIDRKRINALAKGDKSAYTAVIDALYKPVYKFALKLSANQQTAEDITQETFIAVWQNAGTFKGKSKFKTWVFGIAYRQYLRIREKKKLPSVPLDQEDRIADTYDAYRHMQSTDTSERVHRAITAMPENYRQVIFLVHIEGQSYRETAEILDAPIGTIKSRMNQAFKLLREALQESENENEM